MLLYNYKNINKYLIKLFIKNKGVIFMKSIRQFFLGVICLLPFMSNITFAGPEECSVSNAKFQKTYKTISHSLLSNNIWRNEKEKELFFNCVRAEKKFVYEIIGKDQSIPLEKNTIGFFEPKANGQLIGNTRNLTIYPIEMELEPGEYIAALEYQGSTAYLAAIPYYSSDAIEFHQTHDVFAGSWDFQPGKGYMPRLWDSLSFTVKSHYSNGTPVKKAIVRFILSTAHMEYRSGIDFAIVEKKHPGAAKFIKEPFRNATKIGSDGRFY